MASMFYCRKDKREMQPPAKGEIYQSTADEANRKRDRVDIETRFRLP